MRFGGNLWVFPGGRLDTGEVDHRAAAVRETMEETGIELDREALVRLSRWVTPPGLPVRYDALFYAAFVPPRTEPAGTSDEVADARWICPDDALEAFANRELPMWLPTIVTLQQLVGLRDEAAIETAFAPGPAVALGAQPSASIPARLERLDREVVRIDQTWAGGIEGRRSPGWLVGVRQWVVVDPADPTGETSDAIVAEAHRADATLAGVALTDLDPDHHAGVEMFARGHGLPVVAGVGAARFAPYQLTELREGDAVPFGDVPLTVRSALDVASGSRPERLRYEAPGGALPL